MNAKRLAQPRRPNLPPVKRLAAAQPQALSSGEKYDIRPEQSVELLKALHILTRDGKLNQDSRRKLKQVYHLYQFIEPLLAKVQQQHPDVTLVDHGAGKSYLGFILYDLFFKLQAKPGESQPWPRDWRRGARRAGAAQCRAGQRVWL